MRATAFLALLTIAVGPLLAGCLQTSRETASAPAVDDNTFCSGQGPAGSNAYAACMKDRDVARETSRARLDRTHRNVTEQMLNGR